MTGCNSHIRGAVVIVHSEEIDWFYWNNLFELQNSNSSNSAENYQTCYWANWHMTETSICHNSYWEMEQSDRRAESRLELWATRLLWLTICIHLFVSFTLIIVFSLVHWCGQREKDVRQHLLFNVVKKVFLNFMPFWGLDVLGVWLSFYTEKMNLLF